MDTGKPRNAADAAPQDAPARLSGEPAAPTDGGRAIVPVAERDVDAPGPDVAGGGDGGGDDVVVRLRGIRNAFGPHVVHDGLDLDLKRGEILGVVGGSGTGKSVLLRTIVGLQRPVEGRVEVLGTDLMTASDDELAALRRHWGVMFQNGALFSSLNVRENVEVPLHDVPDLSATDRTAIADLKIAMAGLPAKARFDMPAALSGGMRKRAGVARAIALDPEILLLDEPTAGLDPIGASEFDRLIVDLARALNLSVFLVTHDLDTLYACCDRIAVLSQKKVLVTGTLQDMLSVDDPWVHDYFHGPRARAAFATPKPAETE